MKTLVITSGYFNPIGPHHLNYLEASRAFGDHHIVIVNNDKQVALKDSIPFYNQDERLRLVRSLKCVTDAVISTDCGRSIAKSLEKIVFQARDGYNRIIFCNGGDQLSANEEEAEICKKYGVQMMFGVGGGKTGSSSDYLGKAFDLYDRQKNPIRYIDSMGMGERLLRNSKVEKR
jgi:cytidyltransferase-like protein